MYILPTYICYRENVPFWIGQSVHEKHSSPYPTPSPDPTTKVGFLISVRLAIASPTDTSPGPGVASVLTLSALEGPPSPPPIPSRPDPIPMPTSPTLTIPLVDNGDKPSNWIWDWEKGDEADATSRLVDGPGVDEEGDEGVGESFRFLFDTLAMTFELTNLGKGKEIVRYNIYFRSKC